MESHTNLLAEVARRLARMRADEGQTLVEYALIIVTISIAVTGAMLYLSGQLNGVFSQIGGLL